jgi:FHS family L-fucose permease-like MFS transporter
MPLPSSNIPVSSDWKGQNYTRPLIVVIALFFMWAVMGKLNDILIPHLKKAFSLTDFQSSLVQSAFFTAYFVGAIPAGWVMKKVGYKNGILVGLAICALGAGLFYPAADFRMYGFFLAALFIMATGACFLEVAANPYVSVLGDPAKASSRLNLAQGFNGLGGTIAPKLGGLLILSGNEKSQEQISAMSTAEYTAFQIAEADRVKLPYIGLVCLILFVAACIYFSNLPEIKEQGSNENQDSNKPTGSVWRRMHLTLGVLAIFLYVGAQEGVASFVMRLLQHLQIPNLTEHVATNYLSFFWGSFMIGRFAGAYLQTKFDPAKMLAFYAITAATLVLIAMNTSGYIAVGCIVALGFFNSIQFPTIFTLAIKDLGSLTKDGSTYLVMGICGAAIIPPLMGKLSDATNIQFALIIPVICYVYVVYYGLSGSKVRV